MSKYEHVPVMCPEVLENLPKSLQTYMDGTLWQAWHCKMILQKFQNINVIAVDKDQNMIDISKENLKDFQDKVTFIHSSYKNLENILGNKKVDLIFLDLGVNMQHFKDAKRWFSIKKNWPLDMRFDENQKITAKYVLKNYNKDQLKLILEKFGDFKWKLLQDISESICKNKHKLNNTTDLVELMKTIWLSSKKIAVLFQVLRIEVNNELQELEDFLGKFGNYLNSWWRCLILTFHSIEDRMVKNYFKSLHNHWFVNITKKVIFPSLSEIETNKASKSAKLRVIEKI